ncbi:BTB/POZ domain-containing protein 1-like isoform X2 [Eriocheir sinensis]|uniref:BTB/POZ domain-containing protein 1-like isoform X2 n=1 Tax=Eriocheir sinensis TaxID=95602 RepID=UPI0021C96039|nr:BTB/POZ domain-containing protein 1-like isoform X2 [Eriocheir sinensis]
MSGKAGSPGDSRTRPWQDSLHTAGQALNFLLASGTLSDVTLMVGREGKQFRVHRLVLAMRSPVFEDLLLLNTTSKSSVVTLKDDSPSAFYWLLNHIYADKSDIDSTDLALQVLSLADKYMVASAYDISIKVFQENGNAVLMSPALLELTPEAMGQLLCEPLRVTSETVIFKALVKWGQAQLKLQRKPCTTSGLRLEVGQFLPLVRFFTMTSEEFVQSVVTSDVLTPEEVVFVLKSIANPEGDSSSSTSPSTNSVKINTNRESRGFISTKDVTRTCVCEGVSKLWLRDHVYHFQLVPSDNVVLLAFHVQLQGDSEEAQVDIRKEDPGSSVIASARSSSGYMSFKNPVHLREEVTYIVTIHVPNPQTALYGSKFSSQVFEADGFRFNITPGVFVRLLEFF